MRITCLRTQQQWLSTDSTKQCPQTTHTVSSLWRLTPRHAGNGRSHLTESKLLKRSPPRQYRMRCGCKSFYSSPLLLSQACGTHCCTDKFDRFLRRWRPCRRWGPSRHLLCLVPSPDGVVLHFSCCRRGILGRAGGACVLSMHFAVLHVLTPEQAHQLREAHGRQSPSLALHTAVDASGTHTSRIYIHV